MFKLCWLSSVSVFASAVTGLRETEWRVLGDIWKRVRPTSVIQHRKCSDIHTQEATCPHLILSTLPSGMRRNCIRLFAVIPRILVGQCSKKDFWSPLFLIYGQCRNIVCRHAVNLTHNVPFVKTYVIKISVWTLDWTLDWFDSDGGKKRPYNIPVSFDLTPLGFCDFHPLICLNGVAPWWWANIAPLVTAEPSGKTDGEFRWHRLSVGCWKLLRRPADPPVQQNGRDVKRLSACLTTSTKYV